MGVKLKRQKRRNLLVSILYRLIKIPLSSKTKLKLFLDLEWIFSRLCNDVSMTYYENSTHPWRRQSNSFLLNKLSLDFRVLDLGCAQGNFSKVIAGKAALTVGVDYKSDLILAAKAKYEGAKLKFVCSDAREFLMNSTEKFDVLVLSHIIEHLDEPEKLIDEFKSFFDYVYIEVPDFDASLLNHYRSDLGLELVYNDVDHVFEYDRHEIEKLITSCKLQVLDSEYMLGVQRYWCKVC